MRFYKMTGSGNDFVMLDGRTTVEDDWDDDRIRQVCHRRRGIGADGLVILTPSSISPSTVRMAFFNSDGTRAAMCGNAALCSTRLAAHIGIAEEAGMELHSDAGSFLTRCAAGEWQAELNLPEFEAPTVMEVDLAAGEALATRATVGVPHVSVLVADIEAEGLMERGAELRSHPEAGPEGANANFVARPDQQDAPWPIRTYERGVEGETLACGTGTVAVAASLAAAGELTLPQAFLSRGGQVLTVSGRLAGRFWTDVWLRGEGRLVYEGEAADW